MLKTLTKILNRPCPIIESSKDKVVLAIGFGFFIFIFLSVFQPFGLDKVEKYKYLYFSGYGVITSFVILFNGFVSMNLFKDFFLPEKWNIWKSFVHNFIMIIPIAILNWIYFQSVEKPVDLDYSITNFLFMTIAVGFLPSLFLVYFFELRMRHSNENLSAIVNKQLESKLNNNLEVENINIISQNISISIPQNNFLCIKSMGNYITLYFTEENNLKREIIRTTMKKIEEDLYENKTIIRCHKSYFVNINQVTKTSGNARALYLHMDALDFQIPVSRNFSQEINFGTI
ncbi:MAG: LytTR family transcriptional regulator [Bacteroidetes bacterium]|nr:LytTR family transcriptional regulator [Bacteroidota bacterium]MBU1115877.1 LytTR family transcriptional regulator [Bacteroidota bacterium]MBU1797991.1 LytTR family transcriptional regulator [Bacteroidota bacterium]